MPEPSAPPPPTKPRAKSDLPPAALKAALDKQRAPPVKIVSLPSPPGASRTMAVPAPEGLIEPGNIDLYARPVAHNPDGSISTVRSMSTNVDGREVLIPTVREDGRIMGDSEAVDHFMKTGRHLGTFAKPEHADAYAQALHQQQEALYEGAH